MAVGVLTLGALVLHLLGPSRRPLWLDEACTHWTIQAAAGDILRGARTDGSPPLYFLLVQLVTGAVGDSELGLRAVSLLAAVAMVPLGFVVTRRFASDRAALLAAALLGLAPLVHYYSLEARNYALVQLLVLPLAGSLDRALRGPGAWAGWCGVTASLVALLYTHNWAVFLLPAVVIGALIGARTDRIRTTLHATASVAVAALLFLPWIPKVRAGTEAGVGDWIVSWWSTLPPAYAVLRSLESFGFGAAYPPYLTWLAQAPDLRAASILATLIALGAALWLTLRGAIDRRVAGLWSLCLVPLLAGWVYSLAFQPVYLVARYDTIALAPFLILFALGLDGLIRRWPRAGWAAPAAVALLAGATLYGTLGAGSAPPALDVRAARHLVERVGDGDVVVSFGLRQAVVEYYLGRAGIRPTYRAFPLELEEHPGWLSLERVKHDLERQGAVLAGELRRSLADGHRVWVLASPPPRQRLLDAKVLAHLEGHFAPGPGSEPGLLVLELTPRR